MPTGYTSDLYEGKEQTFEQFVLSCARAFGALITMRDAPMDAEIPDEFTPSPYHLEKLEEARQELAKVEAWDEGTADAEALTDYHRKLQRQEEDQERRAAMKARYEAMLEQVEAWRPPTPDHRGLKEFMRQQLLDSIKHDTPSYAETPVRLTAEQYRTARLQKAWRDIDYHTKNYEEEVERVRVRNEWVKALRQSVEGQRV